MQHTFNGYPLAYHNACNHLVAFGAHGGNPRHGRALIAVALVALRHRYGREFTRNARMGMLFISGMFPVKAHGPVTK